MQFRHLLLSSLLAGTTLFFSDIAFAEKNELSDQHKSEKAIEHLIETKSAVHSEAPSKISDNVETNVQSKAESAKRQKGGVKQDPPQSNPKLAPTQKSASVLKNLPDQAKAKVETAINKSKKVIQAPGLEKVAIEQEQRKELKKEKESNFKKVTTNSSLRPLQENNLKSENKAKLHRFVTTSKPNEKAFSTSDYDKGKSSEPVVPNEPKKKNTPTGKKEFPEANQLTNSLQRTNSSGGQSNDRVSYGGWNTVSFLDKWFEWNKFYEIELIQPYLSRQALMKNQWVHAPPSPPPKTAPLLKMVNRC